MALSGFEKNDCGTLVITMAYRVVKTKKNFESRVFPSIQEKNIPFFDLCLELQEILFYDILLY